MKDKNRKMVKKVVYVKENKKNICNDKLEMVNEEKAYVYHLSRNRVKVKRDTLKNKKTQKLTYTKRS